MRYEAYRLGLANGKEKPVYGLGFMLKQRNDSGSWTLLDGTIERQVGWNRKAQEVKPEPDAVKDLVYMKGWGSPSSATCAAGGSSRSISLNKTGRTPRSHPGRRLFRRRGTTGRAS